MNLRQRNLVEDGLRQGGAPTYHIHGSSGQTAYLQGDTQGADAVQGGHRCLKRGEGV